MRFLCLILPLALSSQRSAGDSARQGADQTYRQTISALRAGRYGDGLALAQSGYDACDPGSLRCRTAFLLMIASARQLRSEYRAAISGLEQASTLATRLGHREYQAAAATALASIYSRLGQNDLARQQASRALELLPADTLPAMRSQSLMTAADIEWKAGDQNSASRLFLQSIDEAGRDPDPATLADAWNMYGFDLLQAGKLDAAESALTESFRLRLLFKKGGLDTSYRNLAIAKLRRGDAKSAVNLLDQAVAMFEAGNSRAQGWSLYFRRAQARRAAGDTAGAFADLGRSLEVARLWRAGVLPAAEIQTSADVKLDEVYREYVSTGMQLWNDRRDPKLLARVLVAVEDSRAGSLRQDRSWRANLPPEYWEVLAQCRRLEIAALTHDPGVTPAKLQVSRARLSELESSAGLFSQEKAERIPPNEALSNFRRMLHPGEALASFQLGDGESFAWVLTPTHLELSRLPDRRTIAGAVRRLRSAVLAGQPLDPLASQLYAMLFGGFGAALERSPDWILSLDDELFDAPLALLRSRGRFLVQSHSLRIVPSAFLLDRARNATRPQMFLGIADPVYNLADPRWRPVGVSPPAPVKPGPSAVARQLLELPRLPASSKEVSLAARAWQGGSVLELTGRDANRARIDRALASSPSAVHFAIHVLPSAADPDGVLMAVGLDRDGLPDFYTPAEVAARRLGIPLVVVSACGSGRGNVLRGAGQMGLPRAWLISGTRSVIATRWQTADESGAIFQPLYRDLGRPAEVLSSRRSARALRAAQLEMIAAGDWRSEPRYWAAFFVVGRD